jgi:formylglycine-generating enzyme required for sulfatase activity
VSRFREFVSAYPLSRPTPGAGAHPKVENSGWRSTWDENLPTDRETLVANVTSEGDERCVTPDIWSYTREPGANENKAMSCLTWYEAFAYCSWIGARLPTYAEWNYAAVGGSEQRYYPWSDPADSKLIDATFANYDFNNCGDLSKFECRDHAISDVGARAIGLGRFGQADLAGNVEEWLLDWAAPLSTPCVDCALVNQPNIQSFYRLVAGGSFFDGADQMRGTLSTAALPSERRKTAGIRCAWSLPAQ